MKIFYYITEICLILIDGIWVFIPGVHFLNLIITFLLKRLEVPDKCKQYRHFSNFFHPVPVCLILMCPDT